MERVPLRPVPSRPRGPVDPAEAIRHVTGELSALDVPAAEALALVELAGRPREEVAGSAGMSPDELADALARARKALRRRLYPLPGNGWCERAERMISDRIDGALADPGPARLSVHLANCSRCVEHERRLGQAHDALVAGFLERTSPPPEPPGEPQADEEPPAEPATQPAAALRVVDSAAVSAPRVEPMPQPAEAEEEPVEPPPMLDAEQPVALPEAEDAPALPEGEAAEALPEADEPEALSDADEPEALPDADEPEARAPEDGEPETLREGEEREMLPEAGEPETLREGEEPEMLPEAGEPETLREGEEREMLPEAGEPETLREGEEREMLPEADEPEPVPDTGQREVEGPPPDEHLDAPVPVPAAVPAPRPAPAPRPEPAPYKPAAFQQPFRPDAYPARPAAARPTVPRRDPRAYTSDDTWESIGPLVALLTLAVLLLAFVAALAPGL